MDSTENPDQIEQDASHGPGTASRRGLLRLLGVGGVASAVAFAARPAHAQDTTTTTGTTAGSTSPASTTPVPTTTAPPLAPTESDRHLLAALKSVELSATEAYSVLTPERLAELGYDEQAAQVLAVLGPHHRSYAEALSGMFGPGLLVEANEGVLQALNAQALADGDAATVLKTAQSIEDTVLDTHLTALDSVQSTNMAALLASILIVQARQAAILGNLLGEPYDPSSPAEESGDQALTLSDLVGA